MTYQAAMAALTLATLITLLVFGFGYVAIENFQRNRPTRFALRTAKRNYR